MIAIIDYGLGNIKAFANAYNRFGMPHRLVRTVADLHGATKLILPGVGAFDQAIEMFEASGLRKPVEEMVLIGQVPVLGVCVGMQMFADSSEEGSKPGLGWIKGRVRRFSEEGGSLALPHMGWNSIHIHRSLPLVSDLEPDAAFYFLHSYYFHCENSMDVIASTEYGSKFPCIVNSKNVFGIQFHPEKSHHCGMTILRNFGKA